MRKKSQAALEFLTTYAWAFLVILIMISALAYFGILSPSRLLPDRCNFGAEISCDKNRMVVKNVETNTLEMQIKNNFGLAVMLTNGRITTDVAAAGSCNAEVTPSGGTMTVLPGTAGTTTVLWDSGTTLSLTSDCTGTGATVGGDALTLKEKIKFGIELDYYAASAGSAYKKTIFGEALTSVQS